MKKPENDYEALVLGLQLALTAPDDDKAEEIVREVESMISRSDLSEIDVARAKREANAWWKQTRETYE